MKRVHCGISFYIMKKVCIYFIFRKSMKLADNAQIRKKVFASVGDCGLPYSP